MINLCDRHFKIDLGVDSEEAPDTTCDQKEPTLERWHLTSTHLFW